MEDFEDLTSAARVYWNKALLERLVSYVPGNEIACCIRLLNRFAAGLFRSREDTTVHLSRPVPHFAFKQRYGTPGAMYPLNLKQRQQLVCLSAASGSIDNLAFALQVAGCSPAFAIMRAAAAAGQLQTCQWLLMRSWPWGTSLAAAAGSGHLVLCQWMLDHSCPWDDDAVFEAARGGHVGLMEWLLSRRKALCANAIFAARFGRNLAGEELVIAAAAGCDLAALQRLHDDLLGGRPAVRNNKNNLLSASGAGAGIEPPQEAWEWDAACAWQGCAVAAAALGPSPDWAAKVEALEARGYPQDPLDFVPPGWLLEPRNTTHITHICAGAGTTAAGHQAEAQLEFRLSERLPLLQQRSYLAPAADWVLTAFAAAGDTAGLERLLSSGGLEEHFRAVAAAAAPAAGAEPAAAGDLHQAVAAPAAAAVEAMGGREMEEVVAAAAAFAAEAGHLDFLRALRRAGYLGTGGGGAGGWGQGPARRLAVRAARAGQLPVVAWVAGELVGPDTGRGGGGGRLVARDEQLFSAAAECGDVALMGWLRERGAPVREADFAAAVRGGCEAALEWMASRGEIRGDTRWLLQTAASSGDAATVRWLRRRLLGEEEQGEAATDPPAA